ncbi:hypothetical protein [Shinella oryzae]|uniref:Uncharacterized protein n=1 Tax=Shinella oryzae TaxID=2871820 RepID=A0ABY9K1Q5_9HYPH|nr:hypothetical protein [Shinella oryzae]WLS01743.1 hypothetical protein Q9315_09810 [Shinella oryzae]
MRLSSDKDDAGYRAWCELNGDDKRVTVFLDGVEQRDVTMADDEAGEVRRCVRTPAGNIAVDKNAGEFLMETVKGSVEIQITEGRS